MKTQNILILGGKGKTGSRVAQRLDNFGYENVRVAGRSTTPAFDWNKPEIWPAVIAGMDVVYITFQPDLAIPGAVDIIKNFTTLASQEGIEKMVLLSGRGEKEAQLCEKIVMNTAREWTIVRASWFNQNFSESFFLDSILANHAALPRAEAMEPFVDADDIADVVVEAIIHDKHNGQIYELTGPRLLNFKEVFEEISKATGRDIRFQPISLDENVEMLRADNVPEDYIWLMNYLFSEVLDGRNASVTDDIQKVLGRSAKDFKQYVDETVATGVWNPA